MPRPSNKKSTGTARPQQQIRANSPLVANERIDRDMEMRLHYYADQDDREISRRIDELEEERDLERFLEANAASISLMGLLLGIAFSRKWLLVPIAVGGFLFHHAVKGWCPPLNAMRRMGVRTRQEIDREKYLLKALRGDFEDVRESRNAKGK